MNRAVVYGGVVTAALVGSFLLVAEAQNAPGPAAEYKPAAPVPALMLDQEHHFNQIKDLIGNAGAKNRFEVMEQQAYVLAELGNVNYYQRKAKDYQEWAMTMREDSKSLAVAAKKQDVETAKTLLKKINDTCNACHKQYREDDD